MAGAIVQWLRDGLRIVRSAQEMDLLAASVPDSGGVVLCRLSPVWERLIGNPMRGAC